MTVSGISLYSKLGRHVRQGKNSGPLLVQFGKNWLLLVQIYPKIRVWIENLVQNKGIKFNYFLKGGP